METINYPKLVSQGRAKAIGVPWTEAEAKARAEGVPAEDIRNGTWIQIYDQQTQLQLE